MSHTTQTHQQERQLLLETTLFQEETTLPRLQALLDQLEAPGKAPSWRQFQKAHPELFPPRRRKGWALAGTAAALAALAVALPDAIPEEQAPALPSTQTLSQPRFSPAGLVALRDLADLESLQPSSVTLPADVILHDQPLSLPHDYTLQEGPMDLTPPEPDTVPQEEIQVFDLEQGQE